MVNIKGSVLTETTLYILAALNKPLHGYGIIKVVEEMTSGRVVLGPGTLYGALQTLQKSEFIQAVGIPEGGRNKKTYKITKYGQELLKKELKRIQELAHNIDLSLKEDKCEQ